jgi:hypothetical protein
MNEIQTPRSGHMSRSIGAVVAGFVVVLVLSIGTDKALSIAGIFPTNGQVMSSGLFALATVYRTIYGVLGSYVTALLAPNRPMKHSLIGGAIGFALSIAGAVVTWNHVPSLGPHWYPVALIITALPGAWAGAKLRLMQLSGQS